MRTLDEVINIFEKACDLERRCENCSGCLSQEYGCPYDGAESVPDALHHLKEYRRYQNTPSRHGHMALVDWFEESQKNEPLTWDELRQMEDKPVWIEAESLSVGVSPYWKDWYIIKSFSNDEFMHCNDGFEWAKEMQGRMWQAYRKERENANRRCNTTL